MTEQNYALLMAIGKYEHFPSLSSLSAVYDATELDKVLTREYGYTTNFLADEQVTFANFSKAKKQIPPAPNALSRLIIYFSGYGIRDGNDSLYLATYNMEDPEDTHLLIPVEEIFKAAKSKGYHNTLIILDCNHSGLAGSHLMSTATTESSTTNSNEDYTTNKGSFNLLASAEPTRPSYDHIFTPALVDSLKELKTNDQFWAIDTLHIRVVRRIRGYKHIGEQTPVLFSDGYGKFAFKNKEKISVSSPSELHKLEATAESILFRNNTNPIASLQSNMVPTESITTVAGNMTHEAQASQLVAEPSGSNVTSPDDVLFDQILKSESTQETQEYEGTSKFQTKSGGKKVKLPRGIKNEIAGYYYWRDLVQKTLHALGNPKAQKVFDLFKQVTTVEDFGLLKKKVSGATEISQALGKISRMNLNEHKQRIERNLEVIENNMQKVYKMEMQRYSMQQLNTSTQQSQQITPSTDKLEKDLKKITISEEEESQATTANVETPEEKLQLFLEKHMIRIVKVNPNDSELEVLFKGGVLFSLLREQHRRELAQLVEGHLPFKFTMLTDTIFRADSLQEAMLATQKTLQEWGALKKRLPGLVSYGGGSNKGPYYLDFFTVDPVQVETFKKLFHFDEIQEILVSDKPPAEEKLLEASAAISKGVEEYNKQMTANIANLKVQNKMEQHVPLELTELLEIHNAIMNEIFKHLKSEIFYPDIFRLRRHLDAFALRIISTDSQTKTSSEEPSRFDDIIESVLATKLEEVTGGEILKYLNQNSQQSIAYCSQLIQDLYAPIKANLMQPQSYSHAQFLDDVTQFELQYLDLSRGPEKIRVFKLFIDTTVEADKENIKLLQGYNEQLHQQKQKEMQLEAKLLEEKAIQERHELEKKTQHEQQKQMLQAIKEDHERQLQLFKEQIRVSQEAEAKRLQALLDAQLQQQAEQQQELIATMQTQMEQTQRMMAQQQKDTLGAITKITEAIQKMPSPQVHVSGGGCFTEDSLVKTSTGFVKVSSLQVGDQVESLNMKTGEIEMSSIYLINEHPETFSVRYISYWNDKTGEENTLKLTDDHLVYIQQRHPAAVNKKQLVEAKNVMVQDMIYVLEGAAGKREEMKKCKVLKVEQQEATRVFGIMTMNDTLIVNGVLCSCFTMNEMWGKLDNIVPKALFSIHPSIVKTQAFKKFVALYDSIVEANFGRIWTFVRG